jgi:hypothetical protein
VKLTPSSVALSVVAIISILGLVLTLQGPSKTEVTVTHAVVEATSTTGTGLGVVRTFYIPIEVDGVAADDQYLTGTLTTLADGVSGGMEVRASNLIFVFGDEANQLVVGGISLYPQKGATLSVGQETVRPIVGGSGTYDGVMGQVVSTNLGDQGWSHVFHITTP